MIVQINGKIRTFAARNGTLPWLWCEKDMFKPVPAGTKVPQVDEALVRGSRKTRAAASDMLEVASGAEIKKFMASKNKLMLGFDKWWQIERDFWNSIVGEQGGKTMEEMLLNSLPSLTKDVAPSQSLALIEDIEKSKIHEFVGVASQTTLTEVLKIVRAIACNRGPTWPVTNTAFFTTVRDRVGAFCRFEPPSGSDGAERTMIGKEAIQEKLKTAQTKKLTIPLSLQDIAPFRIFNWLLEPVETLKVDSWLSELTGSKVGAVAEHVKPKGSSSKKAKLEAQKAKARKEKLASLFK